MGCTSRQGGKSKLEQIIFDARDLSKIHLTLAFITTSGGGFSHHQIMYRRGTATAAASAC